MYAKIRKMTIFAEVLQERGFIYQCTNLDALKALKKTDALYIGFDPTAPSLHVGNLLALMILRHASACGLQVIVILGGATGVIGDPSFKDQSRVLLDHQTVQINREKILDSVKKIVGKKAIILDNYEWFKDFNYIDIVRNYGSKLSVNRMIGFDSVAHRLKQNQSLSFLELNYMVMQAIDFVYLRKNMQPKKSNDIVRE